MELNEQNNIKIIELTALKKADELYGPIINGRIYKRFYDELNELVVNNKVNVVVDLLKLKGGKVLFLPRLSVGNSFIMFLLGLSNVNPLPKHNYCPKCHTFHWGKKKGDICEYCGSSLKEDGFNLTYELFAEDIGKEDYYFSFSSSKNGITKEDGYKLFVQKELKLAKLLGIKQEELNEVPDNFEEIIKCFDVKYYSKKYKKNNIVNHSAFIDLGDLGLPMVQHMATIKKLKTFDELVNVAVELHGTGVLDSNNYYETEIYSRDDLYKLLKDNRFDRSDALLICRETRLNGHGHLSPYSESKLKEAGLEEKYIGYMRSVGYLFYKAHVISHLKLTLRLANIYLFQPERYYKAYCILHKKIIDKMYGKAMDIDLLKYLVTVKSSELENICLSLLEKNERI